MLTIKYRYLVAFIVSFVCLFFGTWTPIPSYQNKDGKEMLPDRIFSSQEREIISFLKVHYPNTILNKEQSIFFQKLSSIDQWKNFFSYSVSLDQIESIKIEKDMLNFVSIEVYQRNNNRIPILMYHSVDNSGLGITKETFINHLNLLYQSGFTCMKLDDYLKGDFSQIPEGRKPVILTFDDGWNCHFSFSDKEGTKIKPDCVVGLLENFYLQHPLFGKAGVFFLYTSILPFTLSLHSYQEANLWIQKVEYLENNGFEIGCHTHHHKNLGKSTDQEVQSELTNFYNLFKKATKQSLEKSMFLAYPWGVLPKNSKIISSYSYKNNKIRIAFIASKGFASTIFSQNDNPLQIHRISGYDSLIIPFLKEKTFIKNSYHITLPKLFLSSNQLLKQWIETKTTYQIQYLLTDPNLVYTVCD